MLKAFKVILSVLIALICTVFTIKNSQVVNVNLWPFPFEFQLTLSLVILGSFGFGALLGGGIIWLSRLSRKLFAVKEEEKPNNSI